VCRLVCQLFHFLVPGRPDARAITAAVMIALSGHCIVGFAFWTIVWCCKKGCDHGCALLTVICLASISFTAWMLVFFGDSATASGCVVPDRGS
jgi:hypothetical protein